VSFFPDGLTVFPANWGKSDRESWGVEWRIPPCTVPLDDLVALAQLLSCRRIDDTGGMAFLESADSLKLWQTLKAKYPDMAVLQLKRAN